MLFSHAYQVVKNKPKSFDAIPGPSGRYNLPYIGHVFHFKPFGRFLPSTFTEFLQDLRRQHGPVVKLRLGDQWMVFLFNPVDFQRLLFQYEKYPIRPTPSLMCAYAQRNNVPLSMAFQNNEKWLELRQPIQELMLKPNAISRHFKWIVEIADDFINFRIDGSNQLRDTLSELTRLSVENSGMLCYNTRLGCFTRDYQELLYSIRDVCYFLGQSFDRFPSYCFFPTKFYRDFEQAYGIVRKATSEIMNECIQTINYKLALSVKDFTFMEQLLLDPRMSRDVVESALTDMFIAGADITANVLSFVLYHLAKNPTAQDRLYTEIRQRCKDSELNESMFANMPYLKACIKESLRLVPPVRDGIRREIERDTVVAGFTIPSGTTLVLCNSVISSDEDHFPDPLAYIPERWLRNTETRGTMHPFAVLPFGFGRRNCVGKRIAELQMHVFIVKLLQRYSLSLADPEEELPYHYLLFATPSRKFSILLQNRLQSSDDVNISHRKRPCQYQQPDGSPLSFGH